SGLSDPLWWKQKVSRWRGAATDVKVLHDGEAWLCVAGIRSAGDSRDFYRTFVASVTSKGPDTTCRETKIESCRSTRQRQHSSRHGSSKSNWGFCFASMKV